MSDVHHGDQRLVARSMSDGVLQIEVSNRRTRRLGFNAFCYLLDDLLIDSAFSNASQVVVPYFGRHTLSAIACTHNHEDHTGNAGSIAEQQGCPVYLHNHKRAFDEGVGRLAPYRRWAWGPPAPYQPKEMLERIEGKRTLTKVLATGHSQTQVCLYEEGTGLLFCGDLIVSRYVTGVMTHENPYETIDALRRVAALNPKRLYNGHGLVLSDPAPVLLEKADRLDQAADQIKSFHQRGMSERRMVHAIFKKGHLRDVLGSWFTGGEFSRKNFVRACIAHR